MDSSNFYKPSTGWAEVKIRLSKPLQASYELGGDQNGLSQHLQASYILGGGKNGLYEVLQVPYTLGGGQNGPFKIPQASYALDGGQNPTVRTSTTLLRTGRRSKMTRLYC